MKPASSPAEEIARQLRDGILRTSQSKWASPVVLDVEADGSHRFCIYCRRLDAVTKKDSYPLPRMNDCASGTDSL